MNRYIDRDTHDNIPTVGDHIKVSLPGEAPWAEVLEVRLPLARARISSKLFREHSLAERRAWVGDNFDTIEPLPELHKYKRGDELWFEFAQDKDGWRWVPRVVQ